MESNGRESGCCPCFTSRSDTKCKSCALHYERHGRRGTASFVLTFLGKTNDHNRRKCEASRYENWSMLRLAGKKRKQTGTTERYFNLGEFGVSRLLKCGCLVSSTLGSRRLCPAKELRDITKWRCSPKLVFKAVCWLRGLGSRRYAGS